MMKRILKALLPLTLTLTLMAPIAPVHAASAEAEGAPSEEWTRYPLIAHGLGGIDGVDYTNSLEAFKANYDKGQRVFEVDFSLTKDGQLAARHDWMGYLAQKFEQDIPEEKLEEPLTLREFKSYKILEQYTPLSFADVARISKQYPDVYFITDTKETDPDLVIKQFTIIRNTVNRIDPTILDRFIPEIYSPEMMDIVKGIIPFKHVIFSIYLSPMEPDEVVQYVQDNNIHVIAMPTERATKSFIQKLNAVGAVTYAHSLNKVSDVRSLLRMGVHGVYTDFLSYNDLGIDPAPLAATVPTAPQSETDKLTAVSAASAAGTQTAVVNNTAKAPQNAWEKVKLMFSEIFFDMI
jgi:glycerophosphoryl diester phosphodiesterase